MNTSRRSLIAAIPTAFVVGAAPAFAGLQSQATQSTSKDDLYPSQDPNLVRDIVGASHSQISRVRELLQQHPALAKAAWDWGFGDWETALGAASHTGQREIATLLIEHGARPDMFTLAMLGHLDALRALIEAQPGIQKLHGPHGITLLRHATAGGDKSAAVVAYLKSLGDADIGHTVVEIPAEWQPRYLGEYRFGPGARDTFTILKTGEQLSIRRGADGSPRRLCHQGKHSFHPAGAANVAIKIAVQDDRVVSLEIVDGPSRLEAQRSS